MMYPRSIAVLLAVLCLPVVCQADSGPVVATGQQNAAEPAMVLTLPRTPVFQLPLAPAAVDMPGEVLELVSMNMVLDGGRPGPRITFPAAVPTAQAIRKMALRQVSARRNRCAGTMREALGWGLGDAHVWANELPYKGFDKRPKNGARPGDIVVWPFTFGSRRSQHIGFAVGTDAGVKLLSNLSGNLCVSRLAPGYAAFYAG
ncbi:MAG: CHAP domain-containing protein [Armatimonadia bacterium]